MSGASDNSFILPKPILILQIGPSAGSVWRFHLATEEIFYFLVAKSFATRLILFNIISWCFSRIIPLPEVSDAFIFTLFLIKLHCCITGNIHLVLFCTQSLCRMCLTFLFTHCILCSLQFTAHCLSFNFLLFVTFLERIFTVSWISVSFIWIFSNNVFSCS